MRRKNVPCSPCSGGSSGSCGCCGLKEKLRILWDRTIGSILKINDITPDGDGNFTIEAGSNIALSETGTGNGIRIDTTGGVSYYTGDGQYIDVDNNDLEISAIVGTGGLAKDSDVQTLATGLTNLLNGGNVGSDTKPIKIVNGVAVAVTNDLQEKLTPTIQYLDPRNDLTGLTITKRDNVQNACSWSTYGKIGILNVSIKIQGTRQGLTGWYNLFPDLVSTLNDYLPPYILYDRTNGILNGDQIYVESNQTYDIFVSYQCVFIKRS